MRLIFHAMLGLSLAVAATGLVCGAVARERPAHAGTDGHRAHHREGEPRPTAESQVAPPLPVLPRYGEAVAPGATLAWHLMDGTDGADVELSKTPTFEAGQTKAIEVDGETLKLPAGLPAGVWYWRVRGRQGEVVGERTTPTWMVDVVVPQAAADPAWG